MTQILAVVAVSVGAFIHGTTVSFPAVAIPSLKSSNNSADLRKPEDAFMPFHVYDHDISLIGIIAPNYSLINSVLFLSLVTWNPVKTFLHQNCCVEKFHVGI